jgi:hypothetical protein
MSAPHGVQPFASEAELRALIQAFEDHTVTHEQWNHRGHLGVACAYVEAYGESAFERFRERLKALNKAHRVVDAPTSGYHETITKFWIIVIAHEFERMAGETLLTKANYILEHYSAKGTILLHYSRPLIMSAEAKKGFVEPDLIPLPTHGGTSTIASP